MSRPLVLVVTVSLDGFLADTAGGVDWLAPPPATVPDDYTALMDSIDTLIMGSATYRVSLELEGGTDVFAGKQVHVFTSRADLEPYPGVNFVHEPAEHFTVRLKETPGGTIWLFGGGLLATALAQADLIDEYLIIVQPVVLGDGIPLWVAPHSRVDLELIDAKSWPGGLAELHYRRRARS